MKMTWLASCRLIVSNLERLSEHLCLECLSISCFTKIQVVQTKLLPNYNGFFSSSSLNCWYKCKKLSYNQYRGYHASHYRIQTLWRIVESASSHYSINLVWVNCGMWFCNHSKSDASLQFCIIYFVSSPLPTSTVYFLVIRHATSFE